MLVTGSSALQDYEKLTQPLNMVDRYGNEFDVDEAFANNEQRRTIFEKPPIWLLDELEADEIMDKWEDSMNNDAASIDYQPRIGILTQPVSSANRKLYGYDHYILEVNMNFVRWSGSVPVVIPYDIEQQDLSELLP